MTDASEERSLDLGYVAHAMGRKLWFMVISAGGRKTVPVAFSMEQARELRRRLNEADLDE